MKVAKQKIAIIAIDPQYDFHDLPEDRQVITGYDEQGKAIRVAPALPVPGSWEDAQRLGAFIKAHKSVISKIVVTLDSHQRYDIAHPLYWVDAQGNHPAPFTEIKNAEIVAGAWRPVNPALMQHVLDYTAALEAEGKYSLFIWPPHCLVGEPGHNVVRPVMEAIAEWESSRFTRYMPLSKGHNPHTEHYGGCEAEYPMPNDPTTRLNKKFIESIEQNDINFITGQALSHCVASTVVQIADNFSEENIKKLVLLVDTSSPVAGFEQQARDFVDSMVKRGMRIVNTTDVKVDRNGNISL